MMLLALLLLLQSACIAPHGVQLQWNSQAGVNYFKVYRSSAGGSSNYIGTTTSIYFLDQSASARPHGETESYQITSVKVVNGVENESAKSAPVNVTMP
jgi:fibronectin type 3 domain-containing protein